MVHEREHCRVLVLPTDGHTERDAKMRKSTILWNLILINKVLIQPKQFGYSRQKLECWRMQGNAWLKMEIWACQPMSIEIVQLYKFCFKEKHTGPTKTLYHKIKHGYEKNDSEYTEKVCRPKLHGRVLSTVLTITKPHSTWESFQWVLKG